jgi:hypothetical protein
MRIRTTQLLEFVLLVVLGSFVVVAQDVALISTLKGSVSIKSASGQVTPASIKAKLLPGDEVSTMKDASTTVLYYTGKEVNLAANKRYVVAQGTEEDSFLKRLGRVFSNLLWSSGSSRSMLGATRKVGKEASVSLRGVHPCMNVLRGNMLMFEWLDLRFVSARRYELIVRKADGSIVKRVTVQDTTLAAITISDTELAPGQEYRWQVWDLGSEKGAGEIAFTVLSEDKIRKLDESLKQIDAECSKDTSGFRRVLLRSLLYVEFDLMREAESSLSTLVQLKPDFAIGHEMLAEVYAKVGKLDQALTEQRIASSLTDTE